MYKKYETIYILKQKKSAYIIEQNEYYCVINL